MLTATTSFNLVRALRSIKPGAHRNALLDIGGEEARLSRELAETIDPENKRSLAGFFVPLDSMVPARQTRDLTTTTGSGAVAIHRAPISSFTDVLRRKAVLGVLGAEFASFWGGNVAVQVPKKTTGATAGWVGEGSALAESTPEFDEDEDVEPKSVGAAVTVTRKMWLHAGGVEFQNYLIAELGAALAAEIDRAAFVGEGSVEPTGLFETSGIPTASIGTNGGPLTRSHLVGAMKQVHAANGDSPATARMGWATNPDVEARLRLTDGGFGAVALWSDDDRILGRPAVATTSVPNDLAKGSGAGLSGLAYGNWGDVLVNHAPAAFVLVNPYSLGASGSVRVTVWLDVKLLFRREESFVLFKDVQTTP